MLESRLKARLDAKKAQLDQRRPLSQAAVRRLETQMTVEWIYHSNAIEGSTLTLRETQLILETGLTIGGKSLREHFEVINHREAIQFVEALVGHDEPITPLHVRQIHQFVLKNIDDENAGQYRQVFVRIAGTNYRPVEAWEVQCSMLEWGDWLNDTAQAEHPIVRAALAHHRLVAIHPFIDGNGRTARLLMNLLLMRDGYPPTIILKANRQQYYRVLAQADLGRTAPVVNFVGRAVERSLTLYLEASSLHLAPPPPDDTTVTLREISKETSYSQEYLSLLARTGKLEAVKRGHIWYTTPRAIAHYQASLPKK